MEKTQNKLSRVEFRFHQEKLPEFLKGISKSLMYMPKVKFKPATLAALVQCAALISVLVIAYSVHLFVAVYFNANLSFSILQMVLMQALLASALSHWVGMANWWRWIHLCFPLAILGMSSWHVPNEIYLAGFIISLSFFLTTFRSQVPFFPSRPIVWRQVEKVMPKNRPLRLIDIGSGLGDMPMYIAKTRPECHIEGIEIAPLPWVVSLARSKLRRSSAIFKLGDYRSLNFADYDVIFAYLSPAAMLALWEKTRQEMKSGSLLISLEFEIPGLTPSMRIAGGEHSPMLYVWRLP
jgi:hypothetical protein